MIVVNESNGQAVLYKSLRGYQGGNVEPVDSHCANPGQSLDAALAVLGYVRTENWKTVPDHADGTRYNAHYAKVVKL